ncbi:MAG TPA: hypothetical protein VN452_07110 [Longilinea sp.]|nr:hypothetical protein [Longilinea sp.]
MSIINRLGTFFVWIGAGGVMVFILSDLAHSPIPALLFGGIICVVLGFYLWWRDPPQPSQNRSRFRIFKRRTKAERQTGQTEEPQGSRHRQSRGHDHEGE